MTPPVFPVLDFESMNKSGTCCPKWQLLDQSQQNPGLQGFGHSKSRLSTGMICFSSSNEGAGGGVRFQGTGHSGDLSVLESNHNPNLAWGQSHSNSQDSLCPLLQYTPGIDGGGRGWRDKHNCTTTSRLWCKGQNQPTLNGRNLGSN